MTRLALAAKCGAFGCSGLATGELVGSEAGLVVGAPMARPPCARSDASAILPTPTPHCSKKWRRVTSRSSARLRGWGPLQGMSLLLRHRLVQIQDRAGDGRPGGQLGDIGILRRVLRVRQCNCGRVEALFLIRILHALELGVVEIANLLQ